MALVSIVVPVYNVERHLSICIESLISQSINDIEIILVNDGSNDKSGEICERYSIQDSRVKTIHISNSGVSAARNIGIKEVTSPYVMFVDSDDRVDSTMVESLIYKAESEKSDFVMCGYKKVFLNCNEEKVQIYSCKAYTGNILGFLGNIEDYIKTPLLQGPCWKLFRTHIINRHNVFFPEDMTYGEDAFFVYEYLKYTHKVSILDKELYYYNVWNADTLSRVFREDKYEINLFLMNKLRELFVYHNISINEKFYYKQICNSYISYLGEICRYGKNIRPEEKFRYILIASDHPETLKAFKTQSSSIQDKLLYRLIKRKKVKKIEKYFKTKGIIRRNFKGLYKILKKL